MLRVAAGYTRQSKKKADKSEASPAAQDEANEKKARDRGCRFLRHYRDVGVSGYGPNANRKAFERLLNACRAGKVHEIIVFDVTRFSRREPKDAIPVVLELFSLGVTITSVCEGSFSPGDTMELIMLITRLDAAHQDGKNKSDMIKGAKRTAKQFGGWLGGIPPYGMESYSEQVTREVDGKAVTLTIRLLRPVPRNADGTDQGSVVLRMVDRVLAYKGKRWEGEKNAHPASIGGVTTWLNTNSVPSQKGGPWRTPTVKRILTDPRLAGFAAEAVYRKDKDGAPTGTLEGYKILRDEETGEPVTIGEALIPPPRWFELQEWLEGRLRGTGSTRARYVLTAMDRLRCECDRPMTGSPRIYKCSRAPGVAEPGKHEGGNTINQDEVNDYVARCIMALLMTAEGDPQTLDVLAEARRRFAQASETPVKRSERASLVGERAAVIKSINELYDDLDSGIYEGRIGRARFRHEKEAREQRLAAIESRIQDVGGPEEAALPVEQWTYTEDPGGDPLGRGSWWAGATVAEKRMLVSLFVDEVRIAKAAGRGGVNRVCQVEKRVTVKMASRKPEEAEAYVQAV